MVIKRDHTGREVWRYAGRVLERNATHVILQAPFMREDSDEGYFVFQQNDRFVEHFYTDRWFNIFQIHDRNDDSLRGWYCNICRPAILNNGSVAADDLALDLFVYPNGDMLILDEDEFAALPLSKAERDAALRGLDGLRRLAQDGLPPFEIFSSTHASK